MARTGRPKVELVLTDDEREQLGRWTRRATSAQALALRSRIVLACADGLDNTTVADRVRCSAATVGKWRARFVEHRLDGLVDEPRPGRPPTISAEQVEDVVVSTLESTPSNATHWTRTKMAERSGLSRSTIGRIWRSFDLKPHREDGFKLSNDPLFVEKVYDVVGLYLNPPEAAVVLCVDEKSQVQALSRSQPAFPMMPGMPEKRTHDYVRHGTTSLFAAFNTADGTVISSLHRRHRAVEFRKFLAKIDAHVPEDLEVHLVCDNYGTRALRLSARHELGHVDDGFVEIPEEPVRVGSIPDQVRRCCCAPRWVTPCRYQRGAQGLTGLGRLRGPPPLAHRAALPGWQTSMCPPPSSAPEPASTQPRRSPQRSPRPPASPQCADLHHCSFPVARHRGGRPSPVAPCCRTKVERQWARRHEMVSSWRGRWAADP